MSRINYFEIIIGKKIDNLPCHRQSIIPENNRFFAYHSGKLLAKNQLFHSIILIIGIDDQGLNCAHVQQPQVLR